ncbi:MAG: tetratricopeptide repeat protein [Candidatus Thermochlorobacter sp.]
MSIRFYITHALALGALAVLSFSQRCLAQSAEEWFSEGLKHLEREEYASAVVAFNRAIAQDSLNLPVAFVKRGFARLRLGDTLGALQDYSTVIKSNRNYLDAYYYRAMLHLAMKDYARAIADFSAAIFLKPQFPEAFYYRALAKLQLGALDEAKSDVSLALEHHATFAEAYSLRGLCNVLLGNDTLAISDFTQALRLRPNPDDYYERGMARLRLNRALEAMLDFDNAIALRQDEPKFYYARGLAKRNAGMRSEAFPDFLAARAKGYEDAERYLKLYGESEEERREDSLRIYGTREIVVEANAPEFEKFVKETRSVTQRGIAVAEFASEQLNAGFAPVVLPNASIEMSPNECNRVLIQTRRPSQVPIQCIAQLLREQAAKTNDAVVKDAALQLTALVREMDIARQMPLSALEVRTRLLEARQILKQLNAYLAEKQKSLR